MCREVGGGVVVVPWSCGGLVVVGSSGRPPVLLGSDMFDQGGDGWYISKTETAGLAKMGGSSGEAVEVRQKDPNVGGGQTAMG